MLKRPLPARTYQVYFHCASQSVNVGPSFLAPDQIEVPAVNKYPARLTENKDRIQSIYRIYQKQDRPRKAQVPEQDRDYTLAGPLAGYPLDKKP
jgi:hypothetical protein